MREVPTFEFNDAADSTLKKTLTQNFLFSHDPTPSEKNGAQLQREPADFWDYNEDDEARPVSIPNRTSRPTNRLRQPLTSRHKNERDDH